MRPPDQSRRAPLRPGTGGAATHGRSSDEECSGEEGAGDRAGDGAEHSGGDGDGEQEGDADEGDDRTHGAEDLGDCARSLPPPLRRGQWHRGWRGGCSECGWRGG